MSQPTSDAVVTRSEERATISTVPGKAGLVRVTKRLVSEERTVTVTVRREELRVEHLDPETGPRGTPGPVTSAAGRLRAPGSTPVLEIVLSEEIVELVTRVVPRERVRVYLDTVTEIVDVEASLGREVVANVVLGAP